VGIYKWMVAEAIFGDKRDTRLSICDQMVPIWVTLCIRRATLAIIAWQSRRAGSKQQIIGWSPQSAYWAVRFRIFLHAHHTAWLLHAMISIP